MLILTNDDINAVLTMRDCIDTFEQTYRDVAAGRAVNGRRSDMITTTAHPDAVYQLKMVGAVMPRYAVGAIRVNSDILSFPVVKGKARKVKVPAAAGQRWVGLVMLFDTATGAPLALFPDGVMQRIRVGATSGLGVRYLARPDACRAAILGSGWQAGAQAQALVATRELQRLVVWSPDTARRTAFAGELERQLGLPVHAATSAEQAVKDADIVMCATNSLQPVLSRQWLHPGMHVGSLREGELDAQTLTAFDRVVVHDRGNMRDDHLVVEKGLSHREKASPLANALATAPSLAELVSGRAATREGDEELTAFLNYHGLGYQFAAAGALLLSKARAAGRGRELPDEWFTQDVHS